VPAGAHTAIQKYCDLEGACTAPKINCPIGGAVSTPCDLNTRTCCIRDPDAGDRSVTCAVEPTSTTTTVGKCYELPLAGDAHFGYSCAAEADCPLTYVCCMRFIEGGGNWASCLPSASCTGMKLP
jgi:hypothetical protein